MTDVVPLSAFTQALTIHELIQKHFKFLLKERLHIAPEVAMYRIGEDESIWRQSKEAKYTYQIFFDGEFICMVEPTNTPAQVELSFFKGFGKLYKEGKIHLNPQMYEIEATEKKKIEDARLKKDIIENPTTGEERMVNEAFKRAKLKKPKKNVKTN